MLGCRDICKINTGPFFFETPCRFPEASAIILYVIYFISSFQFLLKYFKRDSQWEGGGIPALSE